MLFYLDYFISITHNSINYGINFNFIICTIVEICRIFHWNYTKYYLKSKQKTVLRQLRLPYKCFNEKFKNIVGNAFRLASCTWLPFASLKCGSKPPESHESQHSRPSSLSKSFVLLAFSYCACLFSCICFCAYRVQRSESFAVRSR